MSSGKERLDLLLVERGLVESRALGKRLIMAGDVFVDKQPIIKPGTQVRLDATLELRSRPRFVSRGGDKLAAALDGFSIDVGGLTCADVGASTGGFSDCLLQAGASKVYAIDVGYGQLAWKLRQDERVVVMERSNARYVNSLPEAVDLVVMDVSFISLRILFPVVRNWLSDAGQVLALVKPQFEAGRSEVGKGGVVRSREVHGSVLQAVMASASEVGYTPQELMPSPLRGPAGNVEFLLWMALDTEVEPAEYAVLIEECLAEVDYDTE